MEKHRQWLLLAIVLALLMSSGLCLPSLAANVDSNGVLQDTPPQNDAAGHYEQIKGVTLSKTSKLDLWHYSGGYWKVTNPGSEAITVSDRVMGQGDELVIPANDASFTLDLPIEVTREIESGKKIIPVIQPGSGAKLGDLFELPGTFSINKQSSNKYTMTYNVRPKFNLVSTKLLSFARPYGLSIPITVPFIDPKYGYNMYSVFGNGYSAVQVNGWVNANSSMNTSGMPPGWIHPSMITDTKGTIKPGYKLMINSRLMDSAGFTVGQGTFANAGALGLCFEYPVEFTFYVYEEGPSEIYICPKCNKCTLSKDGVCAADTCERWNTPDCGCYDPGTDTPAPPTPPEPVKHICKKCGMDELTAEGVCTSETCKVFSTADCGCYVPPDVKAEAILGLPEKTYEGHPVTANDKSNFWVDGERFSATRAYKEGHARNSFAIVESGTGGRVTRDADDRTKAQVVFPTKGFYNIQLRVTPAYGASSLYDAKPIEVLKTPTVIANLGGVQKENRKQILNVRVATNPDNPLESLYIEIKHKETEQKIHMIHNMKDPSKNVIQNTDLIKTRAIIAEESDDCWTRCRLEFLTKNGSTDDFTYKVYAKDSKGLWDEVITDFTVTPDRPPEALINVAPSFLREASSNKAIIKAEDGSTTDGDQLQRTWSVANAKGYDGTSDVYTSPAAVDPFAGMPYKSASSFSGYQDNSFGTKQSIQLERSGVGKVKLKLDVKDVWTEETLPEYITDADYLTASAMDTTEVINVAPMVSMEPINSQTAEILLLASGDAEYQQLKAMVPDLTTKLLENAVDAQISVEQMSPTPANGITYTAKATAAVELGFQSQGFWENGATVIDDKKLYKAEATWTQGIDPTNCYPSLPFTIYAYDASGVDDLSPVWSCTITQSMVGKVDNGYDAYLTQDNDDKYLYFCIADKTLIIDKATGAVLTTLTTQIGKANSIGDRSIYSYKDDGIYRVDMSNGSAKKIATMKLHLPVRRLKGEDHFLVQNGTLLYRGIFNPRTEQFRMEPLQGTENDDGRMKYQLIGIDTEGKLLVNSWINTREDGSSDTDRLIVRVYSRDNSLLKQAETVTDQKNGSYAIVPIPDAGGVYHYFGITRNMRGSKDASTLSSVTGIYNNYSGSAEAEVSRGDGYPSMAENPLMGIEHGDGKIYLMTGAYWQFLDIGHYAGTQESRGERVKAFYFDPKANKAGECANLGSGVWSGMDRYMEYSARSDAYIALTTSDNNTDPDLAESQTKVVSYGQSIDDILSRYLQRNLSGRSDLSALLVLDQVNECASKNPSEFAKALQERNTMFLFAGDNAKTTYGAQIVGAAGAQGQVIATSDLVDSFLSVLLKEEEDQRNLLQVNTTSAKGGISRTYQLSPSTQYFYEYDVKNLSGTPEQKPKDIISITGQFDQTLPASELLEDQYVVTDSFEEDFNDLELNNYFTFDPDRVTGGVYYMANRTDYVGRDGNYWYKDEGSITFSVPEGSQAVLSFDYDIQMYRVGAWMMQFYVDGEPWRNFVPKDSKGHYTHPVLLGPGTHTLSAKCGEYGKKTLNVWSRLDNLRVSLLEPKKQSPSSEQIETNANVSGEQGWSHVAGSFKLPYTAVSYQAVPTEYHKGAIGDTPYARWISEDVDNKQIRIELPKKAAYVGVETSSSPTRTNGREYGCTYRWNGYSWKCTQNNDDRQDEATNVPKNYALPLCNVEGILDITHNSSSYRGARGTFKSVELIIPQKMNTLIESKHWFATAPNGISKKQIFIENIQFSGKTTVQFAPGAAGNYQLRNLRIYSIQNGVKVYVEDSTLGESSTLSRWTPKDAQMAIVQGAVTEEPDEQKLIYQKGELVAYNVSYFDYESDPSKRQYWRYTHTPFNDGAHPDAGIILDENGAVVSMSGKVLDKPIGRFYVDGKYTVEHWQEDNTRRDAGSSNPDYDKASNICSLTFYIQGGGAAPWITHINTKPVVVKEGDSYKLQIGIDDAEKDELSLITELYYEGKLIYTHRAKGLNADPATRKYANVITGTVPELAQAGKYEVICTVRDWSGVGMDHYKFTVVSEGKITGEVYHTDQWNQNRKKYNLKKYKTEYNVESVFSSYKSQKAPRKRGTNVFWSGERFMLEAAVAGNPTKVTCQISGYPSYVVTMTNSGKKNEKGETIYTGYLWNEDMINKWGRKTPEQLTFRFMATYKGGKTKTDDVAVILDTWDNYYQLHRYF